MLSRYRFVLVSSFALLVSACAGSSDYPQYSEFPPTAPAHSSGTVETPTKPLQCVPFARSASGVKLFGDASLWWDLAAGKYIRSNEPRVGSVLVLTGYAGPKHGHVAVVTAIDSARRIRVDHANWLNDGAIYRNDPVIDVSPDNDWSEVRVWNIRANVLGSRTYAVKGFIWPEHEDGSENVASRD